MLAVLERWLRPPNFRRVSDPFRTGVPHNWTAEVFSLMERLPTTTFLVQTENPSRMRTLLEIWQLEDVWSAPRHIWLGVRVRGEEDFDQLDELVATPAGTRFVELAGDIALGHRVLCPECGFGVVRNCKACRGTGRSIHWLLRGGAMEETR